MAILLSNLWSTDNTLELLELISEPKRTLTFVTLLWKGGALILLKPRTINISIYTRNRCDGDKECNINICQIPPALDSPLLSLHSPVCPAVNLPLKVILDSTWTQLTDPAAHPFLNWPLVQATLHRALIIMTCADEYHSFFVYFGKLFGFYDVLRWRPQIKENAVKLIRLERVGGQ